MILLCGHPALRDVRAPNQGIGLACADQGHPRAALDGNALWTRFLGAQYPVEPYRQLARRRDLGHVLRLGMTAVLILPAKLGIVANRRLCGLHQQYAQEAIPLLADRRVAQVSLFPSNGSAPDKLRLSGKKDSVAASDAFR